MSSDPARARTPGWKFGQFIAGLSIVVLFIGIALLVVAWLFDPAFLARTEKVAAFLAGLIPGTAVAAVVGRHLARRLREHHWNLSSGLSSWLAHEPLLLGLVWVFIVVEFIAASFFVPIYALRLEVVRLGMNPGDVRVVASPGGLPFTLVKETSGGALYRTAKAGFRWGDSVVVEAEGPGVTSERIPVHWSAFALLEVHSGYSLGQVKLVPPNFRVTIRVTPNDASITIRQDAQEMVYTGPQTLQLPQGTVEVIVTAPGHRAHAEHMLIQGDVDRDIVLEPVPGQLKFVAVNAVGAILPDLDVFIDGVKLGGVGDVLSLPPGDHVVHMEKCRNNGLRLVVKNFHVKVLAGTTQSVVKTAQSDQC